MDSQTVTLFGRNLMIMRGNLFEKKIIKWSAVEIASFSALR